MQQTDIQKNKKILLSAYACSPFRGSEPGNGWSWATNLAKMGFQVWCFTNTEDKKEILEELEKLDLPNLHFIFVPLKGKLDKLLLDTSSKKIYLHYSLWQKEAAKIAHKINLVENFDLGHHVTFGSLQQGTFLWKVKGLKYIFGPVGGGQKAPIIFKEYFESAWKIEKIRDLISWWTIKFSTNFKKTITHSYKILVTNADTLDMVKSVKGIDETKIHFVPDAAVPKIIEDISFTPKEAHSKLKLLWVGRMLPRKGLNLVLEALSKIPKKIDYSLTIVGGGEQFDKIEPWIEKYGLDKGDFEILGQIPFFKVLEYYKSSDVFIFCSMRDSLAAQLIEAMAFGLPLITLNLHGAGLVIPENCGIKITPVTRTSTLLDIANAVLTLAENPQLRDEYSKNSYNYSKNNTWVKRIEEVTEKYY